MKPKEKTKMKKGSGLFSTTKTVSNEIFNLRETLINDISRLVEERLRTCGNLKVNGSDKKKELEKIILCDVQIEIYPKLEKSLLDLLHNSGYPAVKFEKKIDFEQLYNQRSN